MKDVLGEAATPEVIEAWGKAYNEIANVFITFEKGMYQQVEDKPGGWANYRDFIVTKKRVEGSWHKTSDDEKTIFVRFFLMSQSPSPHDNDST